MVKEIIILATSVKYRNYCIAGIDKATGEWVRIISDDDSIENAVRMEDMCYADGSVPKVFDVVRIKCKGHRPNFYQPENFLLDDTCYWQKVDRASISDVIKVHPPEDKPYIFYNHTKRIHKDDLEQICKVASDNHSLILISPKNVIVHVNEFPERKTVTISFDYNDCTYKWIPTTDTDFKKRYLELEPFHYRVKERVFLVLSLGVCDPKDGCHYKLVATVLE
ncbi:dual OB domain-containing protein [Phosphitispora fastidiosa]|uniref:dual OB domain-containing protein n=1 Tax=Phosphitispora fastidiosa TaxID=2837202 RepID=UPI001E421CB5|nr:hypothetical protein [Phosphitispora fastidiosa]MBU7006763.1 hypothetical protein [Phosphitispora fastidiosa]